MAVEYIYDKDGNLIEVNDEPTEPTLEEKLGWIGQTLNTDDKDDEEKRGRFPSLLINR